MSRMTTSSMVGWLLAFLGTGLAAIAASVWVRLSSIEEVLAGVISRQAPQIQRINEIRFNILRMSLEARHAMLVETESDRTKTIKLILDLRQQVGKEMQSFESAISTKEGAARFAAVKASVGDFDAAVKKIVEQSAAAADSLRQQAEQLAQAVAVFKLAFRD